MSSDRSGHSEPPSLDYAAAHPAARVGFLERLGLHRPELRAWAMYDWANSAFVTTIMTAVFPIYYSSVAGAHLAPEASQMRFTLSTTIGLVLIAMLAPLLGAMTDFLPVKKRLIKLFMGIGLASTGFMYFIGYNDLLLASLLFVVANIAVNGSFVFYDSLLPHIAKKDEMDRVSSAGYALGYIGGGVLLAIQLVWIDPSIVGLPARQPASPEQGTWPTRVAFLSVAVWWLLFSIPLFRRVPEPPVQMHSDGHGFGDIVNASLSQLWATLRDLRGFKDAFMMLLAFLIYNDGIGTIYRLATIYGEGLHFDRTIMIGAIMITQFVGVPFAFLFGGLAGRIGNRPCIFLTLVVYTFISIGGYFMTTSLHFLLLALGVGMVQGGAQALSRSLFASMVPRHKSGQFFGLFAVMEKFAGIMGPAVWTIMLAAGLPGRTPILSVIAFFAVGGILLALVNVERGRQVAREAEQLAVGEA
ncbi:MAG: MFS transporter [Phycisphaerae bacterium]|nr:MFS transporter [Phycisphaerae bacterium]